MTQLQGRIRLLVVGDDYGMAATLRDILVANSGFEAVERIDGGSLR